MELPVACRLSGAELRLRRETVLDSMRRSTASVEKLEEGYAYEFPCRSDLLRLQDSPNRRFRVFQNTAAMVSALALNNLTLD